MTARIFISYRTADGKDKATALARDLGARFGDEQVFLDKDDLRGGSAWRDEVQRTLGAKPVLLLLITPQLLTAKDASGALRIADPNDPVRREFSAALEAGAHLIPLLCDGVDAPPPAAELPKPFDRLGEYTWRRLRAYDWKSDLERLVDDLKALGIRTGADPVVPQQGKFVRLALLALAVAVLAVAAVLGWRALHPAVVPVAANPPVALVATGQPGTWVATVGADAPFALTLLQQDSQVALTSEPMPIDNREGWAPYRAFWLKLTGTELRDIRYRGKGTVLHELGTPLTVDIAWVLYNGAGDTQIDSGNLHVIAAPDGRSLDGKLWSNGDQADRPIVLRRPR
ncbi:MAG: toll/interleukin-1 receptor domain-containing protein [Caldimonas sp.]